MTKPTIEEIEPIAFEFAKSLIANNEVPNDKLSEKSVKLALQWYEESELRERLIDKIRPNWIDLKQPQLTQSLQDNFRHNNSYWMIETGHFDMQPSLSYGKLTRATFGSSDDESKSLANFVGPTGLEVLYILKEEDAVNFSEEFRPNPPSGIEVRPRIVKSY